MNHNIDQIIDRFAHLTHTPRGRYADHEAAYRQLLERLPKEDYPRQVAASRHWSAAASIALVVGIGIAIAGVYTYRSGYFSTQEEMPGASAVPEAITAQTLVFDNTPLAEIAAILSEAYHTDITLSDPTLATYRITAAFSTDEPLEEILSALTDVSGLAYSEVDGGYVIGKNRQ